jgi:predicted Zn-dependent protease
MRRPAALVLVLAALVLGSCARNPVTGKRQLALVSEEQEIALGKQAAEEVMQSIGAYPDAELQRYVESVGMRMAARSERPKLPWRFVVLDDPTVNAFALPGGPVFVTRGILGHLNSEAELASVLGHEIGHITARHSVQQMSKAQLAQLGLGVGMIFSEDLRQFGQLAGAGLQLMFLKFGRDAERQADKLGFRYMLGQRYDPRQMASVFTTLERTSAQGGGGGLPQWLSTHPDPGDRAETARRRAAEVPDPGGLEVDRDTYLAHVNGIVFGDDPRQGYFRGDTFVHPELRFQLRLPSGWKARNGATALVAASPKQDAVFQLAAAGKLSPEEATRKFFSQEGVRSAGTQVGRVSGLAAAASYFEAQTEQGVVRGIVSFISHQGRTFALVGFTPAERLPAYDTTFREVLASFAPLADPAAAAVQPARVELVKVPRDMTLERFAAEFPSSVPVEVLAIVNEAKSADTLRAGTTVKRIVGGPPPAAAQR